MVIFLGVLSGVFALIHNEGKQLVEAAVEGGKFLVNCGKLLIDRFKAAVYFAFKMINFVFQVIKTRFYAVKTILDLLCAIVNSFVDKLEGDFFNGGMDEVHRVKVYRIRQGSSNGFLIKNSRFFVLTIP